MGNLSASGLNGNDRFGDEAVPFGEILPDLSRKIYFVYRHPICILYVIYLYGSFGKNNGKNGR